MARRSKYQKGVVATKAMHNHQYHVDSNGNGWTTLDCHPDNPKVCHKHKITNYKVIESKSSCHPFCNERYGTPGVGLHGHAMQSKTASPIRNATRKSMNQVRRSANVTQRRMRNKNTNIRSMSINSGDQTGTLKRPVRNTRTTTNSMNNRRRNTGGNY